VALAAAARREALDAEGTRKRLFTGVRSQMLLECALLVPALATARILTHEGLLAGMGTHVDDFVSRSQKALATLRVGTDVGLAALVVASKVVDQIPFGGERATTIPVRANELVVVESRLGGLQLGGRKHQINEKIKRRHGFESCFWGVF